MPFLLNSRQTCLLGAVGIAILACCACDAWLPDIHSMSFTDFPSQLRRGVDRHGSTPVSLPARRWTPSGSVQDRVSDSPRISRIPRAQILALIRDQAATEGRIGSERMLRDHASDNGSTPVSSTARRWTPSGSMQDRVSDSPRNKRIPRAQLLALIRDQAATEGGIGMLRDHETDNVSSSTEHTEHEFVNSEHEFVGLELTMPSEATCSTPSSASPRPDFRLAFAMPSEATGPPPSSASFGHEFRLALLESLHTFLWVFGSLMSAVSAHWTCLSTCSPQTASIGSVSNEVKLPGQMCPPPTATIQISLASGCCAAIVCGLAFFATGHDGKSAEDTITRGGFHPAISLAMMLSGRLTSRQALIYVAAQLAGAVVAASTLRLVSGYGCHEDMLLSALSRDVIDHGRSHSAILLQAILTMTLVLVYLWTDRRRHVMEFPIFVGFVYVASFLAGLQLIGMPVLNPMRSFGIDVVSSAARTEIDEKTIGGLRHDTLAGLFGSIIGALVAVIIDNVLFSDSGEGASTADVDTGGNSARGAAPLKVTLRANSHAPVPRGSALGIVRDGSKLAALSTSAPRSAMFSRSELV